MRPKDELMDTTKPKTGRPSTYTDEIALTICEELALGKSLATVAEIEGMPTVRCMMKWLQKRESFVQMYVRAREASADLLAEEIKDIADAKPAMMTDKGGALRVDPGSVQDKNLRVEARKFLAAKLKPRKYGDRLELASDPDNPLIPPAQDLLETARAVACLLALAGARERALPAIDVTPDRPLLTASVGSAGMPADPIVRDAVQRDNAAAEPGAGARGALPERRLPDSNGEPATGDGDVDYADALSRQAEAQSQQQSTTFPRVIHPGRRPLTGRGR